MNTSSAASKSTRTLRKYAWVGAGWLVLLPHLGALALTIAISLALMTRVFRWE